MKLALALATAALSFLVPAACGASPNGGSEPKGATPDCTPPFVEARISVLDKRGAAAVRTVHVSVTSVNHDGTPAHIRDKKTGHESVFTWVRTLKTPQLEFSLRICVEYPTGGVLFLGFTVSMNGKAGDSLDVEVTNQAGRLLIPIGGSEFVLLERDGIATVHQRVAVG